jgi:hypothetical protein
MAKNTKGMQTPANIKPEEFVEVHYGVLAKV